MPNVSLAIDASGAAQGAQQWASHTAQIRRDTAATTEAVRQLEQAMQMQARIRTAQAVQPGQQTQATQQAIQQQRRLRQAVDETARARERAGRALLTALSTLGNENRALSQRIVFENRLKQALDAGILSQERFNVLQRQGAVQFSAASVRARDLRLNMLGLNSSVAQLSRSLSVLTFGPLSGVGARLVTLNTLLSTGGLRLAAFAGGAVAVALALGQIVTQGQQAEREVARIEGVLRATGGTAGLTAGEINELARDIGANTLASVEGAREASAQLLTFRSIAGETFERTLRAAQDLAELGFGTIQSATVQLAKALEDPATNLSNLRRVGISFTRAQEEQIKALVESGDRLEAQNILLKQIEAQAGGTGTAVGTTLAGQFDTLVESIKAASEDLNIFFGLTEKLAAVIDFLNRGIEDAVETPEERLATLAARIEALQQAQAAGAGVPGLVGPGGVGDALDAANREREAILLSALQAEGERRTARIRGDRAQEQLAADEAAAAFEKLRQELDDTAKAEAEFEKIQRTLNNALAKFPELQEEANRLLQIGREQTLGNTTAARARRKEIEEQDKALQKLIAAENKARLELEGLAGSLQQQVVDRREDLIATQQGEAAIAALAAQREIEAALLEATVLALQRGTPLRDEERDEIVATATELANLNRQIKAEQEARKEQERLAQEQARAIQEPFLNAARSIQGAFTNMFEDIFSGGVDSFEDLAETAKRIFIRLAAEIATLLIFRPVLQGVSGAGIGGQSTGIGQLVGGGGGGLAQSVLGLFGFGGAGTATAGPAPVDARFASQLLDLQSGTFSDVGRVSQNNPLPVNIPGLTSVLRGLTGTTAGLPQGIQNAILDTTIKLGGSASTAGSIVRGLNTGVSNIGGSVLGGFVGSQVSNLLGTGQTTVGQIGGVLGSLVGGFFGSIIPGVGTTVGAALGQIAGAAGLEGIEIAVKGGDPLDVQSDSAFKRFLVAELRTGGLTGGLAGTRAAFNEPPKAEGFLTGGLGQPFGTGVPGGFVRAVSDFERSISRFLSTEEIERATRNLENRPALVEKFRQFDNEAFTLSIDRIDAVLESIVREAGKDPGRDSFIGRARVGDLTFDLFKAAGGFEELDLDEPESLQKVQEEVARFLRERAEVRATIEGTLAALQAPPPIPLTPVEEELRRINRFFADLKDDAEDLFLSDSDIAKIEQARVLAIQRLREQFEDDLRNQIQAIEDPVGFAFEELVQRFDELRRSAEAVGADILLVEKLVGLERQQLIERFAGQARETLQNLLDQLTAGPASRLPATERLAAAETLFETERDAALGGDLDAIGRLAQAATNLLSVSDEVFASSEQFFQRQTFVLETIRTVLATIENLPQFQVEGLRSLEEVQQLQDLQGFQSGGSFRIRGGGGADSNVVAFRASSGERVDVTPEGSLEERLDAVGRAIVVSSAEDRELLRDLLQSTEKNRKSQARVERLLAQVLRREVA